MRPRVGKAHRDFWWRIDKKDVKSSEKLSFEIPQKIFLSKIELI
jgi:hypothetical protein